MAGRGKVFAGLRLRRTVFFDVDSPATAKGSMRLPVARQLIAKPFVETTLSRVAPPAFVVRSAERDGLVETLKAVRKRAEQGR